MSVFTLSHVVCYLAGVFPFELVGFALACRFARSESSSACLKAHKRNVRQESHTSHVRQKIHNRNARQETHIGNVSQNTPTRNIRQNRHTRNVSQNTPSRKVRQKTHIIQTRHTSECQIENTLQECQTEYI